MAPIAPIVDAIAPKKPLGCGLRFFCLQPMSPRTSNHNGGQEEAMTNLSPDRVLTSGLRQDSIRTLNPDRLLTDKNLSVRTLSGLRVLIES